jgi:hypothetical protein
VPCDDVQRAAVGKKTVFSALWIRNFSLVGMSPSTRDKSSEIDPQSHFLNRPVTNTIQDDFDKIIKIENKFLFIHSFVYNAYAHGYPTTKSIKIYNSTIAYMQCYCDPLLMPIPDQKPDSEPAPMIKPERRL